MQNSVLVWPVLVSVCCLDITQLAQYKSVGLVSIHRLVLVTQCWFWMTRLRFLDYIIRRPLS